MKKAAITGGTGFIGQHIVRKLESLGYEVVFIGRSDIIGETSILKEKLKGASLVINLAGSPIVKKWTEENKKSIYHSRIYTTTNLVYALDTQSTELFISASAIGIYSDDQDQTENNCTFSDDYLAYICSNWEKEALQCSSNIRTVIFRFGVVLGNGGVLQKIIPLFKLGLGSIIGNGRQAYSWVQIRDVIGAISFVIENKECKGVYNLTAPHPVSYKIFAQTLAAKLKRKVWMYVPGFVIKMMYGEGALVLLKGQRVFPERLLEEGYKFQFPEIASALENILHQNSDS
jgi:uncharacterized protein (TIGR01777 family)